MPYTKRPARHDAKAPDGFTVGGWRQIHKGGYVRIVGTRHYHQDLAQWVGMWVYVEIADGWAVNANVWPDEPWSDPKSMLCCTNDLDWAAGTTNNTRRRGGTL